jgi:hypothetical protein
MRDVIIAERYKYIIDQKKRLNDATFKIAAFYQTVILVILGAQFKILEITQKNEISAELGTLGSLGLFWCTIGLTVVSLAILVGGIAAWFDYRKEEVRIEQEFGGLRREMPTLRGMLRWYETYIALTMVGTAFAYWLVLRWIILPRLAL